MRPQINPKAKFFPTVGNPVPSSLNLCSIVGRASAQIGGSPTVHTASIWRTPHIGRGLVKALVVVCLFVPSTTSLTAQMDSKGALTGRVTDPSGAPVAFALVTATSIDTDQVRPAATGTDGTYRFSLPPGNYEMRFESAGYQTLEIPSARVNVTKAAVLDEELEADTQTNTTAARPQNPPPAPSPKPTAPSLEDLGISPTQATGNPQYQAMLDRRSHMLQVHQRLGLITTIPLLATIFTGPGAKGHHGLPGPASGRDLHAALGATTAGLYFSTAYFAIRAPKIPNTRTHGPIRVHKALAWIHGPGMVLTPILGAIAYSQLSNGQRIHGIAKYHSDVAYVTAAAYGAAIISVSVRF